MRAVLFACLAAGAAAQSNVTIDLSAGKLKRYEVTLSERGSAFFRVNLPNSEHVQFEVVHEQQYVVTTKLSSPSTKLEGALDHGQELKTVHTNSKSGRLSVRAVRHARNELLLDATLGSSDASARIVLPPSAVSPAGFDVYTCTSNRTALKVQAGCCSAFDFNCGVTCTAGVESEECCRLKGVGCTAAQLQQHRTSAQQPAEGSSWLSQHAYLRDDQKQLGTSPKGLLWRLRRVMLQNSWSLNEESLVIVRMGDVYVPREWNTELYDGAVLGSIKRRIPYSRNPSIQDNTTSMDVEYRIEAPTTPAAHAIADNLQEQPVIHELGLTLQLGAPGYQPLPTAPPSGGGSSRKGLWIGLGVTGGVLLIGIIAAVVYFRKERGHTNLDGKTEFEMYSNELVE